MESLSTTGVSRLLGINPNRLSRAVWDGRLDRPGQAPDGAFLWGEKNIRQASWVLLHRDLDAVLAAREKEGDQP